MVGNLHAYGSLRKVPGISGDEDAVTHLRGGHDDRIRQPDPSVPPQYRGAVCHGPIDRQLPKSVQPAPQGYLFGLILSADHDLHPGHKADCRIGIGLQQVAGLRLEGETLEELAEKLPGAILDLLEAGGEFDDGVDVPVELIAHASTRIRSPAA